MPTFGARAVAAAWPVLRAAGALTTVILTTSTTAVDYVTGVVTSTGVPETVEAKVSPFRPDEVDGIRIAVADRKVLVPVVNLVTGLPLTPPTLATTASWDGEEWHCQAKPEKVSNDGLWQLHVRQIGQV